MATRARTDALAEALPEVFAPFGRIVLRRMFGGHGVYHEGRMFALAVDGRLFLKTDATSRGAFDARGLAPFGYERHGKPVQLSYSEAPPEMFEDAEAARLWAGRAWEAAVRSGTPRRA